MVQTSFSVMPEVVIDISTCAVPALTPVTSPLLSTVATVVLFDIKLTTAPALGSTFL